MTDINELFTVEAHGLGAEMNVLGPDGEKTNVWLLIVGVDSIKWSDISRGYRKKLAANDYTDKEEKTEAIEAMTTEMVASAVIGWRGLTADNVDFEYTEESALKMMQSAPYIKDQVDIFIINRVNFIKG